MTDEEKVQLKVELTKILITDLKNHLKIYGERDKQYGYEGVESDELKIELSYDDEKICSYTIDL
jgi:hypothetical protein